MCNILDFIKSSASNFPNKIAFFDDENEMTFLELLVNSKRIGTSIAGLTNVHRRPIAVLCERSPKSVALFLGVVFSGNFYVPVDMHCPKERIETMLKILNPELILSEYDDNELPGGFSAVSYRELINAVPDEGLLGEICSDISEDDPLFAIFTSGSTGMPKCIVKSHRSMMSFIESFTELFSIDSNTIFGNQTPFYFDASTKDIYSTLKTGASTYIIPKVAFAFPMELMNVMNKHKINTVVWVPSVLNIIANLHILDESKPEHLKKLFFVGEPMYTKYLNTWLEKLPDVMYINLYGTTEAAGNCLYNIIDRVSEENTVVPLGSAFPGTRVFLIDESGCDADSGEICIFGSCVAIGYYMAPDDNSKFCRNPLNDAYYERICRTGDIARKTKDGVFEFISRKDFQIKHMGNRIELGDIEASALSVDGVESCCCVYTGETDKIILFFVSSSVDRKNLKSYLTDKLPRYMIPNKIVSLPEMPLNANGKIDRKKLMDKAKDERK